MSIEIKILTMGIAVTNCYVVGDTDSGKAVVIDPVDEAARIHQTAQDAGWTVELILATHGHFDHVLASKALKDLTGAPFYIHEEDMRFLDVLPQTGLRYTGQLFPEAAEPDRFLTSEPETIEVGTIRLETLFTPGHAPGHICFHMPDHNLVFNGDTLFKGNIARTDLPDADQSLLIRSIVDKLFALGDDTQLLPGHMEPTTVGQERRTNPFIRLYTDDFSS